MREADAFNASVTGIGDPNAARRDYDLGEGRPLVGLLDNPMYPPYIWDMPHSHNCMEIGVCLSGHGWVSIGERAWPFREGTVILAPRDVPHTQKNEGEAVTHWRYVLVNETAYINETPLRSRPAVQKLLQSIPSGVYLEPEGASERIREAIAALFDRYRQCGALDDVELDALLRLLMARVCAVPEALQAGDAAPPDARRMIEPALHYVSERYAQEIRVEDMAASCAMSESYFRKMFVGIMGMPPLEYVNRYRINRSIHLLYATDETVLAIAGRTGFPSIATYNRNFRRYVGVSPAQWRKNAHRCSGKK